MELDNQMIDLTKNSLPTVNDQIQINESLSQAEPQNSGDFLPSETEPPEEQEMGKVENTSEQEAKKEDQPKSYIDKLLCVFNFIRPYFKVTFNDIKLRLKSSFIPIKNPQS